MIIKFNGRLKMADKYLEGKREAIKNSATDEQINAVLNRVYDDGFEDGSNEGKD